jgi:hypothetical protein
MAAPPSTARRDRFRLTPPRALDVAASIALALIIRHAWPDAGDQAPIGVAFWGIVFSAILQALGWLGEQAVTLAITAAQVAVWIGQAVWSLIQATGAAFGRVLGWVNAFWSHVLQPFVKATWAELRHGYQWAKRWATRLTDAIEKIRSRVLAIYDQWFRPVFDAIEAVRKTLQLLALFRVQWAADLDRRLGHLEDRLLWPIREAMLRLNQAINWINRIITFDGYLQRVTLIGSLFRHAIESWEVLLQPQLRGLDPNDTARRRLVKYEPIDAAKLARELRDYYETGTGPIAELANAAADERDVLTVAG